ncbi:MAG: SDR family NAD(P)-dependent oxidoreductase [Polyangiaceae bacterium]
MDWIVTGASRGIGRALTLALARKAARGDRLFVLARDEGRLRSLAAEAGGEGEVIPIPADLARDGGARAAGTRLAGEVSRGATLIHNAGVWPTRLALVDGVEQAFATNCLGLLALQAPLLDAGLVARVLVVSAGLLVKGRFDAEKTPVGADFSAFRTYCTTKLAGAVAMREAARRHPDVDFAVVHPGVVRTDLGDSPGVLGWIMNLVKRRFEAPEVCADRLVRLLERPQWEAHPGEAPWFHEEQAQPWPVAVDRDEKAVLATLDRLRSEAGREAH